MAPKLQGRADVLSRLLYGSSIGAIFLCVALWIRAKIVGEDERGNAERRALFVGLWPPTLWLMADTIARMTSPPARKRLPLPRRRARA
jgi:hypothetical protein